MTTQNNKGIFVLVVKNHEQKIFEMKEEFPVLVAYLVSCVCCYKIPIE